MYWRLFVGGAFLFAVWYWRPDFFLAAVVLVIVLSGVAMLARGQERSGGDGRLLALVADRLGGGFRARRSLGYRFESGMVQVREMRLEDQARGDQVLLELSTELQDRVPLCFVVRRRGPGVKWIRLVQNTPIPDVRFEYSLQAVETSSPLLEAAGNQPGMLEEHFFTGGIFNMLQELVKPGGRSHLGFQSLLFNGRALSTLWLVDETEPSSQELRLAMLQTLLLATELSATLEDIRFHARV